MTVVVLAAGGLIAVTAAADDEVAFLAALFSFGVLLAFARRPAGGDPASLHGTEPAIGRTAYRGTSAIRGADVPVPAVIGLVLTLAVWVAAMVTHPGARYAGPDLARGGARRLRARAPSPGRGLAGARRLARRAGGLAEPALSKILVPMKLGLIGEEMIATAVNLAQERGSDVEALHVVRMPLSKSLDAPADPAEEERAVESLEEARLLGEDHGVVVRGSTVRARSIGEAIVDQAKAKDVDLIVLGSAPRWRSQSRFFSPTVEYVLRNAPCEVLVVAFPERVLADEG